MNKTFRSFFMILAFLFLGAGTGFTSQWEFQTEPTPWIKQAGTYVFGNTLIFKINERTCNGKVPRMQMFITSYLSDKLKKAEGKTIEAKVFTEAKDGVLEYTNKMRILSTFSLGEAIGITDPSASDAMGIAILEVNPDFQFWPLYKLPGMETYFPQAHINLSFSNTEIFDLQHETWTMSGISKALYDASQYCLKTYGIAIKGFEPNNKTNKAESGQELNFGNGDSYRGELKDGKVHGRGTYIYANGNVVIGIWDNGNIIQGTANYANGNVYVGSFKDGQRHGRGTFQFSDGEKYVGEWKNDMQFGKGTITMRDGMSFTGNFKDNAPDGRGFMLLVGGDKILGEYKDGEFVAD